MHCPSCACGLDKFTQVFTYIKIGFLVLELTGYFSQTVLILCTVGYSKCVGKSTKSLELHNLRRDLGNRE